MCTRFSGPMLLLVLCASIQWLGAGQAVAGQYCERTNYSRPGYHQCREGLSIAG